MWTRWCWSWSEPWSARVAFSHCAEVATLPGDHAPSASRRPIVERHRAQTASHLLRINYCKMPVAGYIYVVCWIHVRAHSIGGGDSGRGSARVEECMCVRACVRARARVRVCVWRGRNTHVAHEPTSRPAHQRGSANMTHFSNAERNEEGDIDKPTGMSNHLSSYCLHRVHRLSLRRWPALAPCPDELGIGVHEVIQLEAAVQLGLVLASRRSLALRLLLAAWNNAPRRWRPWLRGNEERRGLPAHHALTPARRC